MATTRPWVQQLHQSGAATGQTIIFNGTTWVPADSGAGASRCRVALTAVGGERVLWLNAVPVLNTDQVFVNGLRKVWGGVDYSLSSTAIVFVTALTAGQVVVVDYETTGACGIGVLAKAPTGFKRPTPLTRKVRRYHRIR